jgi:hypothetical protein
VLHVVAWVFMRMLRYAKHTGSLVTQDITQTHSGLGCRTACTRHSWHGAGVAQVVHESRWAGVRLCGPPSAVMLRVRQQHSVLWGPHEAREQANSCA